MLILAIDPGETTGWCLYDSVAACVLTGGCFPGVSFDAPDIPRPDFMLLERPKGYGPTRPQVVDCAWTAGRLFERLPLVMGNMPIHAWTRHEVCKELTRACHGAVSVRNDATAWAACKLLHGGDAADSRAKKATKKAPASPAGPLGGITSHARAACALAVAYTWQLKEATKYLDKIPF